MKIMVVEWTNGLDQLLIKRPDKLTIWGRFPIMRGLIVSVHDGDLVGIRSLSGFATRGKTIIQILE